MTIDKQKTVSICGYRRREMQIAGIKHNFTDCLVQRVYQEIILLYGKGFDTFLCGLYDGFEMMAAQAVLSARQKHPQIKIVAVIPFIGQEVAYSLRDREIYETLCRSIDNYIFTSQDFHQQAFAGYGEFLGDNCSCLLCFHSGLPCISSHALWRATQRGIDVRNVYFYRNV